MTYNIPAELVPYLEYIPEEHMPGIITDALRAAIFAQPEKPQEVKTEQLDISQLLEQIQALGLKPSAKVESVIKESVSSDVGVVAADLGGDDIPDDLKEIVGDFSAGVFK